LHCALLMKKGEDGQKNPGYNPFPTAPYESADVVWTIEGSNGTSESCRRGFSILSKVGRKKKRERKLATAQMAVRKVKKGAQKKGGSS